MRVSNAVQEGTQFLTKKHSKTNSLELNLPKIKQKQNKESVLPKITQNEGKQKQNKRGKMREREGEGERELDLSLNNREEHK